MNKNSVKIEEIYFFWTYDLRFESNHPLTGKNEVKFGSDGSGHFCYLLMLGWYFWTIFSLNWAKRWRLLEGFILCHLSFILYCTYIWESMILLIVNPLELPWKTWNCQRLICVSSLINSVSSSLDKAVSGSSPYSMRSKELRISAFS